MKTCDQLFRIFPQLCAWSITVGMGLSAHGQTDCKARAFAVMERIRTDLDQAEQGRLYSKVRVTSKPTDASEPITKEIMELIAGDQRTAYATGQLLMLEDKDARVVVMPMDSMVYIYDHMPTQLSQQETWWKYTNMAFKVGKLLTCAGSEGKHGDELTIEFDVSAIKELSGIRKLRFKLDATRAKPMTYRSLFGPGGPVQERTFEFLAYEPGKADPRVTKSVLAQVLPNGRLVSAFHSYEVKDLRSKRPDLILPEQRP
jgi:hypothetical protein